MESMMKKLKKLKQKLKYGSSKITDEEDSFLENGSISLEKNEEKLFLENGGIFLEKLIADCNDKSVPIQKFSSSEILQATNNFDLSYLAKPLLEWNREWYKGIIKDKPYLIKRIFGNIDGEEAYNDIVLSVRMSNHNNFLKLIGCCFEFCFLVVVFEYAEHACLSEEGRIVVNGEESISPWNVRLKIAKEVAIAVSYLHTAFPRIIIYNNIELTNIFLDKDWKAKLTDFTFSISLPEGKSKIQDDKFSGKVWYTDPFYLHTSFLSEYSDVYSFGVCLLVFLTGRSAYDLFKESNSDGDLLGIIDYAKSLYEYGKVDQVIDPMIAEYITSGQRLQVEALIVLAFRCLQYKDEDRPKMIQVAKELKHIEGLELSLDASSAIRFLHTEMFEDGPSMVKSTRNFKFKTEFMLILCFCITGFLVALLFG